MFTVYALRIRFFVTRKSLTSEKKQRVFISLRIKTAGFSVLLVQNKKR